ncbi:1-deoxy-D-xylulose-5-phosphate synthase [Fusobacterium nucleatum subsp. nucleatum ATCC 25586]|uniref:1-deoxy-D-xylulose-5-phosphate synthase n=1 Tax=Fusobacterium nucleatum subsp. nucleatum (strain ATCC 25586 / DSM 15643 / BCRC 10681 / CIP 101130 / JCM 8532 / KCTC 2640 / LMG 13131 / VPI 4355) TaxID=190304 RepID=Q8R606_FUSNN|nr:1-deoxy-D-xylulose-5-phosphate synthase [Fusobacterium nucleatum]AAL95657.1 1-deoxyxylulose-5-phosphate synthase [Fusobacterium nucleatum subsp. nucleatum ATCC 25586]AVQ15749.1 1-deoxy-D-xylulose-5-phosphate synthase [Fusobacterium nucleatum subsp. nucleatum ATCC 25586]WMS28785.1 1-deoxy-D-xylulose-5-phosphate synthase [Fusobacterium nucleatum]
MYLEKINSPEDVKKLNIEEMKVLAQEIREAIIKRDAIHGGHFGPNLGIVEATIALHYVFESPKDKFVFDVSHQTYPHKILTGRREAFTDEAHYDDVTGYSNQNESEHDHFILGHTSTSISLALGLAKARDVKGETGNVGAIVGDGSLSGGEALEGLDFAGGELKSNFIIVVNDNEMSIAENHGGLYKNLKLLRETEGKAECNLFKAIGLEYIFIKDGNNLEELIETLKKVKDINHPIVVHIYTQKGKGYKLAEEDKESWHYTMPFNIENGKPLNEDIEDYCNITKEYLIKKMKEDKTVVTITAGTPGDFGFSKKERDELGSQFVDVGIAEQTAVAMSSGMASKGAKPVFTVVSSFIQRTYDQLSQDLCINNNPATIVVFYGGAIGMTDVTHLGWFDIAMMSNIPNLVYLAPTTKEEHLAMLEWSIGQQEHPVAIRIPGGKVVSNGKKVTKDFSKLNTYEVNQKGEKVAIIGLGTFYQLGEKAAKLYEEKIGVKVTVINPMYITGVDEKLLEELKKDHSIVITLEDGVLDGGFGEKIARFYGNSDMKVLNYGLKKEFLDRYNIGKVLTKNRLKADLIVEDLLKF